MTLFPKSTCITTSEKIMHLFYKKMSNSVTIIASHTNRKFVIMISVNERNTCTLNYSISFHHKMISLEKYSICAAVHSKYRTAFVLVVWSQFNAPNCHKLRPSQQNNLNSVDLLVLACLACFPLSNTNDSIILGCSFDANLIFNLNVKQKKLKEYFVANFMHLSL